MTKTEKGHGNGVQVSGPEAKMADVMPKMVRRKDSDVDNPERSELDPANDDRRRCKKNSLSVLSFIGKRTKQVCDRGSEIGKVHSWRDGERPILLRKPKESARRENCEKDLIVFRQHSGYALSLQ